MLLVDFKANLSYPSSANKFYFIGGNLLSSWSSFFPVKFQILQFLSEIPSN